ncbi:hypothetical protein [Georgenia yuyongxinii]|uniref:NUDIX domain-containing protein n=1 Tax=Georgenia yuyongxinii TaxID=2589797 RepID=A0A552WJW2_9MICO|nr:hypothetical protein [Georgenia yuyongxinii]TRW43048.1 hypothetical protein FJ693_19210 [Georgenia yuyongxinii]
MTTTLGYDTVHRTPTRDFSCFVVDDTGRLLLVRRGWAGLWSHPLDGQAARGEPMARAIARLGGAQLALPLTNAVCVLPGTSTAPPVYLAEVGLAEPDPDLTRLVAHRWVDPEELGRAVVVAPWALSAALVTHVRRLADVDPVGLSLELAG